LLLLLVVVLVIVAVMAAFVLSFFLLFFLLLSSPLLFEEEDRQRLPIVYRDKKWNVMMLKKIEEVSLSYCLLKMRRRRLITAAL